MSEEATVFAMLRYKFLFLLLSLAFVQFLTPGDTARIPQTTPNAADIKKCGYEVRKLIAH